MWSLWRQSSRLKTVKDYGRMNFDDLQCLHLLGLSAFQNHLNNKIRTNHFWPINRDIFAYSQLPPVVYDASSTNFLNLNWYLLNFTPHQAFKTKTRKHVGRNSALQSINYGRLLVPQLAPGFRQSQAFQIQSWRPTVTVNWALVATEICGFE